MCMLLYFQITAFCIIAVSATCLIRSGLILQLPTWRLHRRLSWHFLLHSVLAKLRIINLYYYLPKRYNISH